MSDLLLFSGGIDSVALAFMKRPTLLLFIDYGQVSAQGEQRAARAAAALLNLPLREEKIDCSSLSAGELVGTEAIGLGMSTDWWPFRNQLLVTIAAPIAFSLHLRRILIAVVAGESPFADSTAGFVSQMDALLQLQEGSLRLGAPAVTWTSLELVKRSGVPGSILACSHSCLQGTWACGSCRGCQKWFRVMATTITQE